MLAQFKTLIEEPNLSDILKKDSTETTAVKTLQQALYELGFGQELGWKEAGADGNFGQATASAVKAFAAKNAMDTDGEHITPEIANAMVSKLETAVPLRLIHDLYAEGKVETVLVYKSSDKEAVIALQLLLHQLGFDEELNWKKYGADGDYGGGTTKAVKALSNLVGIPSDGKKLSKELAQRLLDQFAPSLGGGWIKEENTKLPTIGLPPQIKKHSKKGAYTVGKISADDFIRENPEALKEIGLTTSVMRIMAAVSQNEGKLEAVNTYDNSFMTFGMFQWTVGAQTDKGELAALLKKIKDQKPHTFYQCFGQYDLDVSDKHTGTTTGYLSLRGRLLRSPRRKERLRHNDWVIRFWKAGQDPDVQAIEIEHAASRLKNFYWKNSFRVKGHLLSELITSELGVALILDNHVNRPGFIKPCIEKAMEKTDLSNPSSWTSAEERQLIDAYLDIRKTYRWTKVPAMTHAEKRAARTLKLFEADKLDGERGSFVYNPVRSRGLAAPGIQPPMGYRDEDYPEIEQLENGEEKL